MDISPSTFTSSDRTTSIAHDTTYGPRFRARFLPRKWRSFAKLYGLFAVAFVLIWQFWSYQDLRESSNLGQIATRSAVTKATSVLGAALGTFAADVRTLARNPRLRAYAAGDPLSESAAITDFVNLATEKALITQIRYLDREGKERIRVERVGSGVRVCSQNELQNKSQRDYFRQAVELKTGALYVSPLDLNVERGEIEIPWNPVLRMATPIDSSEATAGVLVINYSAERLMVELEKGVAGLQLLNAEGYWLAGVSKERLWGFLFDTSETLATKDPVLWERLVAAESGKVTAGNIHYAVESMRLSSMLVNNMGASDTSNNSNWMVLGTTPVATLASHFNHLNPWVGGIGLLVLAVISAGWSASLDGRRYAEVVQQETEKALIRSERLANLGGLVAGVAHELNTPLGNAVTIASTLSQHSSDLSEQLGSGAIRRSALDDFVANMMEGTTIMLRGLERAAELIGNFKQIAVDQTNEQPRNFKINDLVQNILASSEPQFKHDGVEVVTDIRCEEEIFSYPGLLGQVLMNLINNAHVHAFEDRVTGTITVEATVVSPTEIEISVHDDGQGIPADLHGQVFEPFFTTRLGQGGSGLGLSIVHNIVVKILGGSIKVASSIGEGTRIAVRTPKTFFINTPNTGHST